MVCAVFFCCVCWGDAEGSNFGIPIAAVADLMGKPEEKINGRMTGALVIYSATFMRYAWSNFAPFFRLCGRERVDGSGYSEELSPFRLSCYQ